MSSNIGVQIIDYFTSNMDAYLISVKEHIWISLCALLVAIDRVCNELLRQIR